MTPFGMQIRESPNYTETLTYLNAIFQHREMFLNWGVSPCTMVSAASVRVRRAHGDRRPAACLLVDL